LRNNRRNPSYSMRCWLSLPDCQAIFKKFCGV
jgi:hypothetical protein